MRRSGWSGIVPNPGGHPGTAPWSWVGVFVAAWLAGQVAGALAYGVVEAAFVVAGTASGVAAAELLDGAARAVTAGTPVVALALVQVPMWATQLAAVGLAVATAAPVVGAGPLGVLGWRFRPVDVPLGVLAGVGTQILIGVAYALAGVDADEPARQLTSRGSGPAGALALLALLAVAAPVVEELLFRGVLQRGLAARLPGPAAVGVTAVVFGAVHFQAVQFPGLVVAGLVFGALAWRTGRLGPAVVAHVALNAGTVLPMTLS